MADTSRQILLEPGQGAFFGRLARRMRDVGYLSIVLSIMSFAFTFRSFFLRVSGGGVEAAIAYFSSYFNGNRQVDWGALWMLVDVPINIIVGLLLVQGSRYFGAIAKGDEPVAEPLVGGLLKVKRILDAFYVRLLLAVGLIWLIVLVG